MPNYCTNNLEIYLKEGFDAYTFLRTKIQGDNGFIDFNKIKPIPEILKNIAVGRRKFSDGELARRWFDNEATGECRKLRLDEEITADKHGGDWFEWCSKNWGTKWNALDIKVDLDNASNIVKLQFDTAWRAPEPIIKIIRLMDEVECIAGYWVKEGCESAGVFNNEEQL